MQYKLVIFDLDGTLLDTIADLGNAVNHALEKHGFATHETKEYYTMVGNGVRRLVIRALPEQYRECDEIIDSCLAEFKKWYSEHIDENTVPYPGIPELIRELSDKGVRIAIASNKFQSGVEVLAKRFFPDIPFVAAMGNAEGLPLKPDAELVSLICRRAGIQDADAVMVGDSGVDIQTAANAGIDSIAVSWGFRPRADLAGAGAIVDNADELKKLLS